MVELDAASGFIVKGVKLDEHRFIGRMMGAQLLKIADDPRESEKDKLRVGNPHLEGLYELRKDVQRLFEGAKRANVESYAKYIVAVGEMKISGMTPPIILYSPAPLSMDDTAILIPWDAQIAAIDGETQLAARYEKARHERASFVFNESRRAVRKFHAGDPGKFTQAVDNKPVDEGLGLFAYDPSRIAV